MSFVKASVSTLRRLDAGHDAWIVGEEACVLLDFGGLKGYAQSS
jgi:hypothetical protein